MPAPKSPIAASPSSRLAAGFTLLETVVALTILAAGILALYGMFNTNLIGLGRAQDVAKRLPAARHAMEMLGSVNPWEESSGAFRYQGFDIRWSARLLEPVRNGQDGFGALGEFDLGLYELEFQIGEQGRPIDVWRLRLVGYQKARSLDPWAASLQ